jgi:hypothetical protein
VYHLLKSIYPLVQYGVGKKSHANAFFGGHKSRNSLYMNHLTTGYPVVDVRFNLFTAVQKMDMENFAPSAGISLTDGHGNWVVCLVFRRLISGLLPKHLDFALPSFWSMVYMPFEVK